MHEAAAPLLLTAGIALVHAAYFLALKGRASQQTILLPAMPPAGPQPPLRRKGPYSPNKGGAAVRRHASLRIDAGLFRRPLICSQDLHVAGDAVFDGAVKIEGDLLVTGGAVFEEPVVVNGRVRVTGSATFRAGLLAKSELLIEGQMQVGSPAGGGWLSARWVRIDGALWVNGRPEHASASLRRAAGA